MNSLIGNCFGQVLMIKFSAAINITQHGTGRWIRNGPSLIFDGCHLPGVNNCWHYQFRSATKTGKHLKNKDTTMSDLSRNDAFLRMAFKGGYKHFLLITSMQTMTTNLTAGYDVNGDGKVSVAEFKRIMLRSGLPLTLTNRCLITLYCPLLRKEHSRRNWENAEKGRCG